MVIFINGNLNSGKSTIATLLAEKLGNTAVVEIDQLRSFISWMSIEVAVPLNWENALCIVKNFVNRELHVIVPYPLPQRYYELIQEELSAVETPKHFITLAPSIDVLLKKRGVRELPPEDIKRIKILDEKRIDAPDFGYILDNSQETPSETVERILELINT